MTDNVPTTAYPRRGAIAAASRKTGIPSSTLRRWQKSGIPSCRNRPARGPDDGDDEDDDTTDNLLRQMRHNGAKKNVATENGALLASLAERGQLADLFEDEARAALEQARASRPEANYRQLIAAAVTAADKMLILRESDALTPDDVLRTLQDIEKLIAEHITDETAKESLAAGLGRIAARFGTPDESQRPHRFI